MTKKSFCEYLASLHNLDFLNKKIYKIKIISFTDKLFSFVILKENEILLTYNYTNEYAEKYYNLYLESNK